MLFRSGAETESNAIRASVDQFARAIEHLGLQHKFITAAQILDGSLQRQSYRVLLLPQVLALSPAEATAIRRFVSGGGIVIADGEPGQFDAHSQRLRTPLLADLFAPAFGRGKGIRLAAANRSSNAADPVLITASVSA